MNNKVIKISLKIDFEMHLQLRCVHKKTVKSTRSIQMELDTINILYILSSYFCLGLVWFILGIALFKKPKWTLHIYRVIF
jgi:hypothetical protein